MESGIRHGQSIGLLRVVVGVIMWEQACITSPSCKFVTGAFDGPVDPASRCTAVFQDSLAQWDVEPFAQYLDHLTVHVLLAEGLQRLHHQPGFPVPEAGAFQRGPAERQDLLPDFVLPGRPVGVVDPASGHLRRQSQQVQGRVAGGEDAPVELARQRPGDLVDIRPQFLVQQLTVARVVVDPSADPADLVLPGQGRQRLVDVRLAELGDKIRLGERLTPAAPIDPR